MLLEAFGNRKKDVSDNTMSHSLYHVQFCQRRKYLTDCALVIYHRCWTSTKIYLKAVKCGHNLVFRFVCFSVDMALGFAAHVQSEKQRPQSHIIPHSGTQSHNRAFYFCSLAISLDLNCCHVAAPKYVTLRLLSITWRPQEEMGNNPSKHLPNRQT